MLSEELIERYIGYSLSPKEYTEIVKQRDHGFELKHSPFTSLMSVHARTDEWGFSGMNLGQSVWNEIPISQIHIFQRDSKAFLLLPLTLFGTEYKEAKVTYTAGLTVIPESLQKALEIVDHLVDTGEINAWNNQFPLEVMDILDSFVKEGK